ncbi:MAG: leucine-rich repeat domain-containing protein [Clostridia bacterium]|nr:leucine-rich repeat domain-containing protein [Clostridia bacterium]
MVIPKGVTKIKEGTFSTCIALEYVEIPGTVRTIGECAFSECRSLKTVVIPEGVKNIEEEAFGFCEDLVITIPDSIEWIYPFAFKHSENITIKGSSGSKAEEYAKDYDIIFVEI